MKIKELKEILKHFEGREWDDFDIKLWDYNNQREIEWEGGSHAFSKPEKKLTFPVKVPPIDGKTIDERIKELYNTLKGEKDGVKED